MKSNYRRIGDFIKRSNTKNNDGAYEELLGININKYFMPSVANVVGTDLTKYKIVEPKMFACNRMHVGRDMRLPIALSDKSEPFLVSPAYDVFEIIKPKELLHEYLMMWFTRSEFDRNTWFYTDSDVRGKLGWEDFLDMTLPVPSLEKQQEIVNDYNTVLDRIRINEQLNTALEETAQALYKHWFVDFEFPVAYASSNASSSDTESSSDTASSSDTVSSSGTASSSDTVSSSESRERFPNDKIISSPLENPETKLGYKSSGGAMVYNEELDCEIPEGWEVGYIQDICKIEDGDRGKNYPNIKDFNEKGYCLFLNAGNVTKTGFEFHKVSFIDKAKDESLRKGKLKRNDVVLTTRGTVGNVAFYNDGLEFDDIRINSGMVILRNSELCYWLYTKMKSSEMKLSIQNYLSGSAQPQLPITDLKRIQFPLSPKNILISFNDIIKSIQNSIDNNSYANRSLIDLQFLMLSKMATVVE